MKTFKTLFAIFSFLAISGASSAHAAQVEGAELKGVIQALGGESDEYFLTDAKLGRIQLQYRDAKAYKAIRDLEGGKVTVNGSWDESQDTELIFIVDQVKSLEPAEGEILIGKIRALGGESDVYFIQHPTLGRVLLEHRDSESYEAIRNAEGKTVSLKGSWDESQDEELSFVVDSILKK